MFLILKRNPNAPTGWETVTVSDAETPEEAAKEGFPGVDCELAVVDWPAPTFSVSAKPTVTAIEPEGEE